VTSAFLAVCHPFALPAPVEPEPASAPAAPPAEPPIPNLRGYRRGT